MKKYVPLGKQSKRKQKEYHASQRQDWGMTNPATKKIASGKVYNRKKAKVARQRGLEPQAYGVFMGLQVKLSNTGYSVIYI